MKLSIIIPVYNEERTILEIINEVYKVKIPGFNKEIIIVDDGSTDGTIEKIEKKVKGKNSIQFLKHPKNAGKGAAIRTALKKATGDYIIIQDADLEYHPRYIRRLTSPLKKNMATVIYGTRLNRLPNLSREERSPRFLLHYFGNRFLSFTTSVLYQQRVTDMETCYKLFPMSAVKDMRLNARGFEFEPEITAKLLKRGHKIAEVDIEVNPRGYKDGKKLNTFRDGFKAFWTLFKYRFTE